MKIYNTLKRKKEKFIPIKKNKISMYSCGPTVYNYAHIGNLRTYIFSDTLKRTLKEEGYSVRHIINITDVGHLTTDQDEGEDKLEKGAIREKKTVWEIADFYTNAFKEDIKSLKIISPNKWTRATDHIKEQINLITILEEKGLTYESKEAVYFDTKKIKNYGKLALLKDQKLQTGSGTKSTRRKKAVTIDSNKKNPNDFVLWFKRVGRYKNHTMHWNSKWGDGFPGWHIECSAMSMKHLGNTIDIHTGGVDHIGTHHTNEIAQSENATGKKFVNYWLHGEFLTIKDGKMAKSGNNFITLESLTKKGFHPLDFRYLVLTAHYRTELNFSWKGLEGAMKARERLTKILNQSTNKAKDTEKKATVHEKKFRVALSDDLNTPKAIAELWAMAKSNLPLKIKRNLIVKFEKYLGLGLNINKSKELPKQVEKLLKERELSRDNKQFTHSDTLRKKIEALGYRVEDTKDGSIATPL